MKPLALGITVFLAVLTGATAATRTSVKSGNWSDTNTWAAAVPVNNDTAVIAAGHTVTFDVDQSGFANGITLTVNGTYRPSTNAGTYILKLNGNCTVNSGGSYLVGSATTAYPTQATYKVAINGNVSHTGGGAYGIYCSEPTYSYVKLASAASIGATNLIIDTNLSGDLYWGKAGSLCDVSDINAARECERRTIAAFVRSGTTNTLRITSGLTAAKSVGAYITLASRNVEVYGTTFGGTGTQNGFKSIGATPAVLRCAVRDLFQAFDTSYSVTFSGSASGCSSLMNSTYNSTASATSANMNYVVYSGYNVTYSGLIAGSANGFGNIYNVRYTGVMAGNGNMFGSSSSISVINSALYGGGNPFATCMGIILDGVTITNNSGTAFGTCQGVWANSVTINVAQHSFYNSSHIFLNDVTAGSGGGYVLYQSSARCRRTTMTPSTETIRIGGDYLGVRAYSDSLDHDGVSGAFRAWSPGGIVDSDTGTKVRERSYKHNCTTATWPTYMLREYTLDPQESLRVRAYVRKDRSMSYKPRIQLVSPTADPLLSSNCTALAEAQYSGDTSNVWQAVEAQWTNTNSVPVPVMYRSLAKNASGSVWFEPEVIRMKESW